MVRNSDIYCCDECGVRVSRKYDLARHMKLHASNKEDLYHRCHYEGCEYKTLQRSNLNTHLIKHTGERPYKCPEQDCDFDTADPGALTNHRKREHGYKPKEASGKNSSAGASRRTRRPARFVPYNPSSRPLLGSSTNLVSENAGPSSSGHQVPPRQLPQPVDACLSPSVSVADERVQEGVKNNTAAYETELALKFARGNGSYSGTSPHPPTTCLPSTESLTAPAVPAADPELLFLLEQQNLYTFDQPQEPVTQPTFELGNDAEFERFLSQYNEFMANPESLYGTTSQSHSVDNTPILPTLPAPETLDMTDDMLKAVTPFLSSTNTQYQQQYACVDNTLYESYGNYEYYTQPTSFDTGYAQSKSFAQVPSPDMSVYPQTVAPHSIDQTYSYTAPMDPSSFSDFYAF